MTDRLKNILIGSFVLTALLICVSLIGFLKPTIGDGRKMLSVRFTNIAGINKGTRVSYAGKPVGEVVKIALVQNARLNPTDELGKIYSYQLTLKLDSNVDVCTTDEVAIRTTGLMGERSIAITPKPATEIRLASSDQILYAVSADALENTFNQIARTSTKVDAAVSRFDDWFAKNSDSLSRTSASLADALTAFNDKNILSSLQESIDLLGDNLRLIRTSLSDDRLLGRFSELTDDLGHVVASFNLDGAEALSNLNQITREIADGNGTVGRFIRGDDFYLRLAAVMNKAESMMYDINHYGVLFQYNKQWQRSRTKKAALAQALETPTEFKAYFEGEMDSINSSLGRVANLLERASQSEERERIVQDDAFKKDFSILMRQVQGLNDAVKLYNEELIPRE